MGVENIITFDVHNPCVQNAIPLKGFESVRPGYQFIKGLLREVKDLQIDSKHMMVISPDEGGTSRAVYLANVLGLDMGMFYKRRDYARIVNGRNPIVAHEFLGSSVEGMDVIIIDDMISSAPAASRRGAGSGRSAGGRGGVRRRPDSGAVVPPALVGLYRLDGQHPGAGLPGQPDGLCPGGMAGFPMGGTAAAPLFPDVPRGAGTAVPGDRRIVCGGLGPVPAVPQYRAGDCRSAVRTCVRRRGCRFFQLRRRYRQAPAGYFR